MEIESSSVTSSPLSVQMSTSSGCTDTTLLFSSKICSSPVAHTWLLMIEELELVDDDGDDDGVDDGVDETRIRRVKMKTSIPTFHRLSSTIHSLKPANARDRDQTHSHHRHMSPTSVYFPTFSTHFHCQFRHGNGVLFIRERDDNLGGPWREIVDCNHPLGSRCYLEGN